jgi:predicted DNA-binding transcriptional regulator AlpA
MPDSDLQTILSRVADAMERLSARLDSESPEGLSPTEAAAFCGISVGQFHALAAKGYIGPEPSELGDRCPRYSRTELRAWLMAKSPTRPRWREMRTAVLRRAG